MRGKELQHHLKIESAKQVSNLLSGQISLSRVCFQGHPLFFAVRTTLHIIEQGLGSKSRVTSSLIHENSWKIQYTRRATQRRPQLLFYLLLLCSVDSLQNFYYQQNLGLMLPTSKAAKALVVALSFFSVSHIKRAKRRDLFLTSIRCPQKKRNKGEEASEAS